MNGATHGVSQAKAFSVTHFFMVCFATEVEGRIPTFASISCFTYGNARSRLFVADGRPGMAHK